MSRPGPTGPAPGGIGPETRVTCGARAWLGTVNSARRVLLLGYSREKVVACLGAPVARTKRGVAETWTYRRGLKVGLRHGYVYGWTLTGSALRTQRGKIGVGSRVSALRGALGRRLRWDARLGAYRAVVRQNAKVYADLKFRRSARPPYRVTRIGAAMRTLRQLDGRGRALAGAAKTTR